MKIKKQTQFEIEAASHPGMAGKQNEDRYRATTFLVGKKNLPSILAVLCDGIGGHRAGEIAAEMGVSIITDTICKSDPSRPLDTISNAVTAASNAIYEASQTNRGRAGMGTTCACAWVIGKHLYTANLGDSRIYLLRERHLIQLTTDHTWVQEALDAGLIAEENKENHPNAHVIRRYLGSKIPPEPDFRLWHFEGESDNDALGNQGMKIKSGDIILLCSDGLTDMVTDEEIREVLQAHPLSQVPDILITMANDRGGTDNTTLILIKAPGEDDQNGKRTKKRRLMAGCLGILILISMLATAIFLGISYFKGRLNDEVTSTPIITQDSPETNVEELNRTSVPSLPAISTITSPSDQEMITPQSTITPWPTHTLNP
jgi:protein phosphatase